MMDGAELGEAKSANIDQRSTLNWKAHHWEENSPPATLTSEDSKDGTLDDGIACFGTVAEARIQSNVN